MKLKLMFLCFFSLNAIGMDSSSSQTDPSTTKIKLSSAAILKKRLLLKTGILIGEKTSLVEELADKEIEPIMVAIHIEAAIGAYLDYLTGSLEGKPGLADTYAKRAQEKIPLIFAAIFQDNPECLPQLKDDGIVYALPPEDTPKS